MSIQEEQRLSTDAEAVAVEAPRPGLVRRLTSKIKAGQSFAYVDFRWLWISGCASYLGMNMQWITRGWLVLRLADDSPLALALVVVSFALPMTLISPIGGALADRVPRKRVLIYTQAGNFALTLAVGVLDFTGVITLWMVVLTGFLNGSLMAFNMPSRQATVSDIIPREDLMNGMSLMSSAMNVTRIVGPALAGVLIIFIDTSGVFFLIAGAYAVAAVCTLPIGVGRRGMKKSGKSMFGDIIEGLKYAKRRPRLFGMIIMAFIPALFGFSYYALMPAWAREVLNVQSDNLGLLYMLGGIGALTGSLGLASFPRFQRRGLLLLGSCVIWGLGLAIFSQTTSYAVAAPLLLFMGLVSSIFMSLNMTLVQTYTAPEMRGRMMSILMMTFGAMPLSVAPLGALAERFGTPEALLTSGLLLVVCTLVFAAAFPAFARIK